MEYKEKTHPNRAVIYCRVSSVKQAKEGHGIESQETRCREFAHLKGYEVIEMFKDEAISGGMIDRPGMKSMLSFLRKNKKNPHVVLIDDISRLARSLEAHLQLRTAIGDVGGILESPSIEFGEDSDSLLIENLLASVSQHHREKNKEQTKNRMRARAMNGYWVFQTPVGYKYKKTQEHGKLLVRHEPVASILAEGLNGFASGRFASQGELKRFLESQPDFPKDTKDGKIRYETIIRYLRRPHYAGYIEIPQWDVSLRKGHHQGLISYETFQKNQELIQGNARVMTRKDINADFPLRGYVTCGDCDNPLTSCWSTSKLGKKHPYYMCFKKGCVSYRKSIRRGDIEGEFEGMLKQMRPSVSLFRATTAMFKLAWNMRRDQIETLKSAMKRELTKLDKQIEDFLDRIVESTTPTAISAYERRIAKLEKDKIIMEEKLSRRGASEKTFNEMFEHSLAFLSNPWKLWVSERLEDKRSVLKLAFADRLAYRRNQGFRTPKTALPFKVLGDIDMGKCEMAEREGFEPSRRLPAYTLSRRAPSTTRPPLRTLSLRKQNRIALSHICNIFLGRVDGGIPSTAFIQVQVCDKLKESRHIGV